MENDSARLVDLVDSSLQMVRDSAAYIGVIGLKYGQTPKCPARNPSELSITELECNEAQRLRGPILLFIMGDPASESWVAGWEREEMGTRGSLSLRGRGFWPAPSHFV